MAWVADAAVQVQNLLSTIRTNLLANGWTEYDPVAEAIVYSSVNNQGVTQYVQITQVGSYQYLQFQGFLSWNAGTHAGTSGSGTTVNRLYFAGSAVGATITVDMYMSVTANRFVIYISGLGNYRNWAYFGGLDTLAGTNDPFCVQLIAAFGNAGSIAQGVILQAASGGAYWSQTAVGIVQAHTPATVNIVATQLILGQPLSNDLAQFLLFPVLMNDWVTGGGPRGQLDGLLYCPAGLAAVAHLDTVTVGGTVYLIIQPGGEVTSQTHPITGNYSTCIAIAEV